MYVPHNWYAVAMTLGQTVSTTTLFRSCTQHMHFITLLPSSVHPFLSPSVLLDHLMQLPILLPSVTFSVLQLVSFPTVNDKIKHSFGIECLVLQCLYRGRVDMCLTMSSPCTHCPLKLYTDFSSTSI